MSDFPEQQQRLIASYVTRHHEIMKLPPKERVTAKLQDIAQATFREDGKNSEDGKYLMTLSRKNDKMTLSTKEASEIMDILEEGVTNSTEDGHVWVEIP
jgi:hypothetical protein